MTPTDGRLPDGLIDNIVQSYERGYHMAYAASHEQRQADGREYVRARLILMLDQAEARGRREALALIDLAAQQLTGPIVEVPELSHRDVMALIADDDAALAQPSPAPAPLPESAPRNASTCCCGHAWCVKIGHHKSDECRSAMPLPVLQCYHCGEYHAGPGPEACKRSPAPSEARLREALITAGWAFLHARDHRAICPDRSCFNCKLADMLFAAEQLRPASPVAAPVEPKS